MFSLSLPGPMRRYFDHWFESHNPPSGDSILLHNRRLYILPTGFGYLFAIMLLLLFLAAINYQNSMGFMLMFTLTALGIISLWHTHKNLLGITVQLHIPRPVFCGEMCELELEVSHANNAKRYAIGIQYRQQPPVYLQLEPRGRTRVKLKLPTAQRGLYQLAGLTVFTRYPTGLFHAWGWLRYDLPVLVYPRPSPEARLLQTYIQEYDGQTSTSTIEGDDFAGLREHRTGESLRHISWKAYAQGRGLLTKTFQGHARPSLWIDWDLLDKGSVEARLSFMTALILAAEDGEQKYGLRLPGSVIEQGCGSSHKHHCLQALAMFGKEGHNQELPLADD